MDDIGDRLEDIIDATARAPSGGTTATPAFCYSHTDLAKFMDGLARGDVFTAGSQDVNNRFVASPLLYGSGRSLPVPDLADRPAADGRRQPGRLARQRAHRAEDQDRMHEIVKRGGRVLVIDPRRTETAAQFERLAIGPDGDAFLLLSLLHVLFGESLEDRARLARQATGGGWLELLAARSAPRRRSPHRDRSGDVRTLARDLAAARAQRSTVATASALAKRHADIVSARRRQPGGGQPGPRRRRDVRQLWFPR